MYPVNSNKNIIVLYRYWFRVLKLSILDHGTETLEKRNPQNRHYFYVKYSTTQTKLAQYQLHVKIQSNNNLTQNLRNIINQKTG